MGARSISRRLLAGGGIALTSAVVAVGPALPAHAADCTKTTDGYSHHVVKVCGTKSTRHTTRITPTVAGTHQGTQLPFTGAEITLMGVVGVGLIGGGTMLVAAGRRRRTAPAQA